MGRWLVLRPQIPGFGSPLLGDPPRFFDSDSLKVEGENPFPCSFRVQLCRSRVGSDRWIGTPNPSNYSVSSDFLCDSSDASRQICPLVDSNHSSGKSH